jgi:hypothetical protein
LTEDPEMSMLGRRLRDGWRLSPGYASMNRDSGLPMVKSALNTRLLFTFSLMVV